VTEPQHIRWWNLREAYRAVFRRNDRAPRWTRPVLADLKDFCAPDSVPLRVGKDGHTDMYQTGIVAGRLEVWHRVQQVLNLSDDDLNRMKEIENE
jgi:hypothetical protein